MFEFKKTISPNKKQQSRWLQGLLLLILIPIIFAVLMLVAFAAISKWIYAKFTKKSPRENAEPETRYLVRNQNLCILLHEIKAPEWQEISEVWAENTYDEDETLFLATTEPEIEGIHNRVIATFFMETNNGVFLQRITLAENTGPKEIGSELIWVDYTDLKIKAIEPVGCYFLYLAKSQIKGFNFKENIEINIKNI
jgi:hypothetical protein